jgi:LEA14-like dessication related protein
MKLVQVFISSLLIVFALSSCKVYPPIYKRIDNFHAERLNKDGIQLTGDAMFYNPNKYKFSLADMLMNVEVEGKHVATLGEKTEARISANSEFAVPFNLTVKPEMTLGEGIKTIWNIISKKEVVLTINGTIVVKALGIKIPIPIKETERIDLTKLK